MPKWIEPGNDDARVTFLQRTLTTAGQDLAAGNHYVTESTVNEIKDFLPGFEEKNQAVSQKLSARSKETREGTAALNKLEVYVRDMWEGIKRRVYRLEQPAEVLTFYQLPLSGILPKPTTREDWLTIAENIIKGDAKAVSTGYPEVQNPNADELDQQLQATKTELDEVASADREYDIEQEGLAELRSKANELIKEVMDELRFNLRKKDDSGQRRIMRSYGATYRYLQGEPEGEELIIE